MKTKKLLAIFAALAMSVTALSLAACGKSTPDDPENPENPEPEPPAEETVYGLPVAERGRYIKDADLVQDGETRYLLYTTNETAGEEDNVIALRKGEFEEGEGKGWTYSAETVVIRGETGEWDEYIGSASLVKGTFALGSESYGWLAAYCGTDKTNDTQYRIGLAVAKTPDGAWTKVSETPFIEIDGISATSVGCYAPSLVNYDKESKVRLFYTYADQYGHFAKYTDIDASDLTALSSEQAWEGNFVSNDGEVTGGDSETMFPNADFAYDGTNGKVYAVKDYSPSAATNPKYAEQLQLLWIDNGELGTIDEGDGWKSVKQWDFTDTPDGAYERLYGACVISDAYGRVDGAQEISIVYNVCEIEADNEDWLFTQNLLELKAVLS